MAADISFAQITNSTDTIQQKLQPPPLSPSQRMHAVKIVSPVDVIVNDVWPYQKATGTGPGGQADYSKWTFTLSPKYTEIKEGLNKITSRYACSDNPSIIAYYSVNV